MKRALARYFVIGGGSLALLAGVVGFGHTASGKAVATAVARMAHGGCPFGYDKPMSPAQRERASSNFAATHRGERRAVSRPALGFVLDHTTRTEVIAHFASYGVTCAADKGFSDLTCNGVPSAALGGSTPYAPPRNVWFTFGTKQQLLSVTAFLARPMLDRSVTLSSQARRAWSASGHHQHHPRRRRRGKLSGRPSTPSQRRVPLQRLLRPRTRHQHGQSLHVDGRVSLASRLNAREHSPRLTSGRSRSSSAPLVTTQCPRDSKPLSGTAIE